MKNKMKSFFNDNGFIAMALAVVLVSLMSVIAIARIGVTDTRGLVTSYHALQELHIIRSEAVRSLKATENMLEFATGGGTSVALPTMIDMGGLMRELDSGFGISTFRVRTIVEKESDISSGLFDVSNNYGINSLVTAYVGRMINKKKNLSPVSFYGKKIIKRNSFAGYHYFTDEEDSINADLGDDQKVKFFGKDEIWGKVRSNTDIYIQKTSGPNNGWPLFHDEVYTSGKVISQSGAYPREDVFPGGLTEDLPQIDFPENANAARTGKHYKVADGDVLFVEVEGISFGSFYGNRMLTKIDTVWINGVTYPGNLATIRTIDLPNVVIDTLGYQLLPKIDTLWSNGPSGSVNNNSYFVEGELWIKGTFAGRQTWASQDTMYLAGDILLARTRKGDSPDGKDGPMNGSDVVGLISEKSIIIQYGYRHPTDSMRVKNNCGRYEGFSDDSGDGGIYIYAAMCALGKGETSMQDGVFSFQYQHPHEGLFALHRQTANNNPPFNPVLLSDFTLFKHRLLNDGWGPLRFALRSQPWNPSLAYPFYGPLWPESKAESFRERGSINLFGSVAQRRRGFVHRSGNDPFNNMAEWNLNEYHYGLGPSALGLPNAPGATGTGVGYNKQYKYDNRFRVSPPPKFPEVNLKGGVTQFDAASWYLIRGKDAPQMLKN